MTKQDLRKFIINLLDDEDGINPSSYEGVVKICEQNEWGDVVELIEFNNHEVKLENGRAFLYEDDAEELRKVVVGE